MIFGKKWILFPFFMLGVTNSFATPILGVNYDPTHSMVYTRGVGMDNEEVMKQSIKTDLNQLYDLRTRNNGEFHNISQIKTFYILYGSSAIHQTVKVINIADVINEWNDEHDPDKRHPENRFKLALGVYEFRPGYDPCEEATCLRWTEDQVNAAIQASNKYGSALIDRIFVGNEDLTVEDAMRQRITNDVIYIKKHLPSNSGIKVGIVDRQGLIKSLFNLSSGNFDLYRQLRRSVDFVGDNIYPFWSNKKYGESPFTYSPAKDDFFKTLNELREEMQKLGDGLDKKEIIIGEEGWPSSSEGIPMSNPAMQIVNETEPTPDRTRDYFYFWYTRNDNAKTNGLQGESISASYLFSLYDRNPHKNGISLDAIEPHWGIFSVDGYGSIFDAMGTDYSKSKNLSPDHATVHFTNQIKTQIDPRFPETAPRVAIINACLNDNHDKGTVSWNNCYPIYGRKDLTSAISYGQSDQFLVDVSGDYNSGANYNSLQIAYAASNTDIYNDPKNPPQILCHINREALRHVNSFSTITLSTNSVDADGNCIF